jgi:cytochrome c556
MRVTLLAFALPAAALLATGCSPSDETDTAEADMAEPAMPAAAPEPAEPATPAEVETAAAEPVAEPAAEADDDMDDDDAAMDAMSDEEKAAAQAIDLRESLMKLTAWNMGPIGGMLRGNVPFDAATVEKNATRISALAPMIVPMFAMDTRAYDLDTEALDRVWTEQTDFAEKAGDLEAAAMAAAEAAAGGDEAATRQAMIGIGQACGGCHDDYRKE